MHVTESDFDWSAFEDLRRHTKGSLLSSEWNAVGRWARDDGTTTVRTIDALRILTFPADDGSRSIHSISGPNASAQDVEMILRDVRALERIVAGAVDLQSGPRHRMLRFRDRRFSDYLYDLATQLALEGKQFGRRRGYLRSVQSRATRCRSVPLDLCDEATTRRLQRLNRRWAKGHEGSETIRRESAALTRTLRDAARLPVRGHGVSVDGVLVAFSIFDLNGDVATAHFLKAPKDSALSALNWHSMFEAAHALGAVWMNGGYDAGLEGLRRAKQNLVPQAMLEKDLFTCGKST